VHQPTDDDDLGPLHGIPVLVKDNIATDDAMETTAGSLALVGSVVPADAMLIARLRRAGAVILGKANLSEWANFRGFAPFEGWSARGGFTRDPYKLQLNPSGSSSGSAVGAAANLCAVAIGTETDGSIVAPSGNNLVVGLKPTVGLVSQSGIIPIGHSQDTAGPMTRTVTDAAILLSVMQTPVGAAAGQPADQFLEIRLNAAAPGGEVVGHQQDAAHRQVMLAGRRSRRGTRRRGTRQSSPAGRRSRLGSPACRGGTRR